MWVRMLKVTAPVIGSRTKCSTSIRSCNRPQSRSRTRAGMSVPQSGSSSRETSRRRDPEAENVQFTRR